ncbi:hypothetical protein B0G84_3373 [Paraburkholderia sp. BL8N3]|jgi:hypothetical protein|nr:hypothetical protein [Paraburkholderia sp. BL8N3]TCK38070.1 hypothetical protein B0G84_3373 [Paraburkholderia sp. BL8N3]
MKYPALVTLAAACTLVLSACASQTDNNLMQTVPVGSGTSRLAIYPFVECVKPKWTSLAAKVRQYAPDSDGQILSVHGKGASDSVLILAEPSANGTGYTIYGDVVAASRYVALAHSCD